MDTSLIDEISDAALEPERWPDLLSRLSRDHDEAAAYLGHSRPDSLGSGDVWLFGFGQDWSEIDEEQQGPKSSPAIRALIQVPEGTVFDRREFIPDEVIDRDPVAAAFLTSNGLYHATVSVLCNQDDTFSVFWLGRPRSNPFPSSERSRIVALSAHLARAMRTHAMLRRADAQTRSLRRVVDGLDAGIVLMDAALRVCYANQEAERMLDAQRGMALRHGRVCLDRLRSQAALERGARKLAARPEDTERVVVDVHDARGTQTYELSLAPAIGDGKHDMAPAANVILFIAEIPTEPAPGQVEGLMRRFDLTPAEARVAALIAWSRSRAAVAEQLGISENTVKSHLKVIHDKLGIRTRAELVRHVLRRF